jgi:hypothetical protein
VLCVFQTLRLLDFIIGLITPPMISGTRGFGAHTFVAIFCGLSAVWTWFLVPETKGRSLEDMDHVFGDNAAGQFIGYNTD